MRPPRAHWKQKSSGQLGNSEAKRTNLEGTMNQISLFTSAVCGGLFYAVVRVCLVHEGGVSSEMEVYCIRIHKDGAENYWPPIMCFRSRGGTSGL